MKTLSRIRNAKLNIRNCVLFIVLLFLQFTSSAQCSDVFIYRVNNTLLQSAKSIYVFSEGQQIATVNLGDRYKVTLCTSGQYEFVVKTDPNGVSIIKKTILVEEGDDYYLKLACLTVGDVATIDQIPELKGEKEVQRGKKFKGAIQSINMSNQGLSSGPSLTTTITTQTPTVNPFKSVQTSNGFKFDVINISKAGDMMRLEYKITNLTGNDRILFASGNSSAFYDDVGKFYNIREVCLLSSCRTYRILTSETRHFSRGEIYNSADNTRAVIPYGIPVTGSIVFRGISNQASRFIRGSLLFRSANISNPREFIDFKIEYSNIVFPTDIDPDNPNNRIVGGEEIELINSQVIGDELKVNFNINNKSNVDKEVIVKDANSYDDLGNHSKLSGLSFGTQETNRNRYQRKFTVPASSKSSFNISLNPSNGSAKKIARIKVQFKDYELEWSDIPIRGANSQLASSQSNAINVNDKLVS